MANGGDTFNKSYYFVYQEFCVSGSGNRLTAKSVIRLTSSCPNLRWLGDLRDWAISTWERQYFSPSQEGNKTFLGNWKMQAGEPRTAAQSAITLDHRSFVDEFEM